MFKRKKYLSITIFTAILMIFNTLSFAANEIENVNETEVIVNEDTVTETEEAIEEDIEEVEDTENTEELEELEDENFDEDELSDTGIENSNFYSIGKNDVLIQHEINGNAYIIANNVTIESEINGDVFIIAKEVNITENAYINSLFVLGSNVNVNGSVSTIYVSADNLTLNKSAYIERDVNGIINIFNVFGIVERNANVTFNKISFTENNDDEESQGEIEGDLNYVSEKQVDLNEHSVYGNVHFMKKAEKNMFGYIKDLATFAITVFAVYLVLAWLAPKFNNSSKELLKSKLLPVLGFGALTSFITPIIIAILMLLGITLKISEALLALYVFLLLISTSVFIIAISNLVIEKFNIDVKYKKFGIVSLIAIAMWAIKLIPVLGGIVSVFAVITGMGLIIKSIKSSE